MGKTKNSFLLWNALKRLPLWAKIVLILIYVLSPFDLIPEAILPFIGWIDDAVLIGSALWSWYKNRKQNGKNTKT